MDPASAFDEPERSTTRLDHIELECSEVRHIAPSRAVQSVLRLLKPQFQALHLVDSQCPRLVHHILGRGDSTDQPHHQRRDELLQVKVATHDILEELKAMLKILAYELRFLSSLCPPNKFEQLQLLDRPPFLPVQLKNSCRSRPRFKTAFGERTPHASRMHMRAPSQPSCACRCRGCRPIPCLLPRPCCVRYYCLPISCCCCCCYCCYCYCYY